MTPRVDRRRNPKVFIHEVLIQISLDEYHLFPGLIRFSGTLSPSGYFFLKLHHVSVYVIVNLYNFLAISLTPLLHSPVAVHQISFVLCPPPFAITAYNHSQSCLQPLFSSKHAQICVSNPDHSTALIHLHFLKTLLCLYFQPLPLFLELHVSWPLQLFLDPASSPSCQATAPFPSPLSFFKVCSVLLAPVLPCIPLLSSLHADVCLRLLTFYFSAVRPPSSDAPCGVSHSSRSPLRVRFAGVLPSLL